MSFNLLAEFFKFRRGLVIPQEVEQRFSEESLCRKCGKCCYVSVFYQGRLTIIPELPCRYLVRKSEEVAVCSVYFKRHQVASWCNSVNRDTVSRRLFPDDCVYVRGISGYQGKVMISEGGRLRFYQYLREIFPGQTKPAYISDSDWNNFLLKLKRLNSAQEELALRAK